MDPLELLIRPHSSFCINASACSTTDTIPENDSYSGSGMGVGWTFVVVGVGTGFLGDAGLGLGGFTFTGVKVGSEVLSGLVDFGSSGMSAGLVVGSGVSSSLGDLVPSRESGNVEVSCLGISVTSGLGPRSESEMDLTVEHPITKLDKIKLANPARMMFFKEPNIMTLGSILRISPILKD